MTMNAIEVADYVRSELDKMANSFTLELRKKDEDINNLRGELNNLDGKAVGNSFGKEKVKEPEEFKGDRKKTNLFIYQIGIVFAAQSNIYRTDVAKIRYANSFCRGSAQQWAQNNSINSKFDNITFDEYKKMLVSAFGEFDAHNENLNKIKTLKQRGACTEYTTEFNILAAQTHLDDPSKRDYYKEGLKDKVLDLLITSDEPEDFVKYQEMAIKFDNRIHEREMKRKKGINQNNQIRVPEVTPVKPSIVSKTTDSVTPMDLDAIKLMFSNYQNSTNKSTEFRRSALSPEQKEHRRKNNLCIYCGKDECGGFPDVKECSTLKKKNQGKGQRQN